MLVGPAADAKPGVVGKVEQPVRAVGPVDHLVGKDRLVADQRAHGRQARQPQGARPGPGGEVDRPVRELGERQHPAETHVLAERHQMELVVGSDDIPLGVDGVHAVPQPRRRGRRGRRAHRAANQHAAARGDRRDHAAPDGVVGDDVGYRRLRPYHMADALDAVARGKLELAGEQRFAELRPPLVVLSDVRLDKPQQNAFDGACIGRGEAQRAAAPHRR